MALKIVTVNIPDQYLDYIQTLVGNRKKYPSRSHVFRQAVEEFLHNEPTVMEDLACV